MIFLEQHRLDRLATQPAGRHRHIERLAHQPRLPQPVKPAAAERHRQKRELPDEGIDEEGDEVDPEHHRGTPADLDHAPSHLGEIGLGDDHAQERDTDQEIKDLQGAHVTDPQPQCRPRNS